MADRKPIKAASGVATEFGTGDTVAVANGGTGQTTAALAIEALLAGLSATQGVIPYRGSSAWAALATGTAGQVLTSGGAGANPSWASAAGVTGFTSALNTSSPNNTVNASSLTASGGSTNQDAVIAPKGTGALIAAIPNDAASGGGKRGQYAVDLQLSRTQWNYTAGGDYSAILAGVDNCIEGAKSAIIAGEGNYAASNSSVILGGTYNAGVADCSVALGAFGMASIKYQIAHGGLRFSSSGDVQTSQYILRAQTTNGTITEMTTGTSGRLVIPSDSTWTFSILIVARRTDADNESAGYKVEGVIDKNSGAASTALVGSVTKTVLAEDTAAWDVTVTADTTNGALKIEVTGESAKSINWVAFVRTVETTG